MAAASPRVDELSSDQRRLIQAWLDEFARSWQAGALAERARRLPATGPVRLPALTEMVKIDLARQWASGALVWLEEYLTTYPELGTTETVAVDLIRAEYDARHAAGDPVTLESFAQRFPRQADELRLFLAQGATAVCGPPTPPPAPTVKPSGPTHTDVTPPPSPESLTNLTGPFGRYQIVRKLGQGGMGAVYLAHDAQLDRPIAIKVPFFRAEDGPEVRQRFYREARAAATLSHPNICAVHEVGEINGIPYLSMTYVEGKPLSAVVEGGKTLPQRTAATVVRKLALALHEAHQRGVIHRDLKPSNIMINAWREPVIMDFGLARRMNHESTMSRPGAIMGTPAYMPPEVIKGQGPAGAVGDVYSLGVILYELLTGQLPFQGPFTAILAQIVMKDAPPPSSYRLDIDPRLEMVCLNAMARDPQLRYRSMAEMAAALTDYLRATLQTNLARPEGDDLVVLTPAELSRAPDTARPAAPPTAVPVLQPVPQPGAVPVLQPVQPARAVPAVPVAPRAVPVKPAIPVLPAKMLAPGRPQGLEVPRAPGLLSRGLKVFGPVVLLMLGVGVAAGVVYYFCFSATAYYQAAQKLAARGEYEEAIAQYTLAIRRDSMMREAFQGRAEAYFHRGQHALAANDCTRAIQLNPTSPRAFAFRAGANDRLGDFNRAMEDCNDALRLDRDLALAYTFRGDINANLGHNDLALEDINRAIGLDRLQALSYAYRANVYGQIGKLAEALEDCDTAVSLDSHLGVAYAYRGVIRMRQGQESEAMADFDQAIRLAADDAEVYNARGNARFGRRDYKLAVDDFARATDLAPGNALYHYRLSLAYAKTGSRTKAQEHYDEAVRLLPSLRDRYSRP